MITVNTPDGGIAQFPDGTPDDVMLDALRKKFGAPQPAQPAATQPAPSEYDQAYQTGKAYYSQNPDGRTMAAIRGMVQGGTFGYGDEIVARLASISPNLTYDEALGYERAALDQNRAQHPVATTGAEIATSMAIPMGAIGEGTLAARALKGVGMGAIQGGLYGSGTSEGGFKSRFLDGAKGAVAGAAIGSAIPLVGRGVQKLADNSAKRKAIADIVRGAPSTEALRDAGSKAYKAVDDAGVSILPSAMKSATDDILSAMRGKGLDEGGGALSLTPKSARVAELMADVPNTNAPIPFSELDKLRRKAGIAAADIGNRADASLGAEAISGLDNFVTGLGPQHLASGDADALKGNISLARDLWAKMSRSQLIDDAISGGENYVSGTGSGIRNRISTILKNPKLSRGFSDAEKEVLRRVANGSMSEKMLQWMGGGLGHLLSTSGGFAGGGPVGAATGLALSAASRKAADALTRRNAEYARAFIAGGGMKSAPKATPKAANAIEEMLRRALRPVAPDFGQLVLPPSQPR